MTRPKESLNAVARAVANSGELPDNMSVLLQEADFDSDADISLPLLEIQIEQVDNVIVHNTDLVGYITDSNGNRTGRIYYSEYEMTLSLDIWTTPEDAYDVDELGSKLRDALYPYSSYGVGQSFLDDEQNPIDQITYFRLGTGQRIDDLLRTPSVRKWSQEVELWGCEEFRTDEDYIIDVNYPENGDFNDDDTDLVIESDVSG
jgi:hypothetical protein